MADLSWVKTYDNVIPNTRPRSMLLDYIPLEAEITLERKSSIEEKSVYRTSKECSCQCQWVEEPFDDIVWQDESQRLSCKA